MSDQRIGTCTVCLTIATLPYATRTAHPPPGTPTAGRSGLRPAEGDVLEPSVASELAVRRAVRAGGLDTEPLDLVLLVVLEVALEPEPLRLALVGEDVRRHPVQEPPVVADHHGAARELLQSTLEAAQRLDVEVVGRLVEEQQVPALLEGQGEVEAVPLTTGQDAGRLLLVRSLEPERGDVRARRHLDVADLDVVEPVGDDVPQGLLRVYAAAVLLDVGELDGLADLDLAVVRLLLADQHLEQRGLAGAVGADDADAQPRARRDLDLLEVQLAELVGLRGHLLVAGQPRLALGLAGLRAGADPLQLVLETLLALGVLGALDLEAGRP